jgi:hypothetical protein
MSDRDALMLTLIRGLEGAATALDVVDDETRQQIGALLSPKARQLLAALTAPAPPTPTAEAADASADQCAPAAASEEAPEPAVEEPPEKKPAVFGVPAAAFVVTGFDDLPEDALGAIASFSDIKTLTCVATCRALRDAAAKLSPRLEHALVLKKFPLLGTVVKSPEGSPAPGELFSTYTRYFPEGPRRRPARPEPTTALDAYTLSLELELWKRTPAPAQKGRRSRAKVTPPKTDIKSIWTGAGTFIDAGPNSGAYEFAIPAGVYDKAMGFEHREWRLTAKVMASRRVDGRLQFAKLFKGGIMDVMDDGTIMFDWENVPHSRKNKGLDWQRRTYLDSEMYVDPQLHLFWSAESSHFSRPKSKVEARFVFSTEYDDNNMTLSDACMCLEHYVEWSE